MFYTFAISNLVANNTNDGLREDSFLRCLLSVSLYRCGNPTLKRVSVTLNEDGSQQIHINSKRQLTSRGINSLPSLKYCQSFLWTIFWHMEGSVFAGNLRFFEDFP